MKIHKIFISFAITFTLFSMVQPVDAATVNAPIYHEQYFKTEKDLFGYNPGFEPNVVTFDCNNRPYIRTHSTGKLQTLDSAGNWVVIDLVAAARAAYRPDQNNGLVWDVGNSGLLFRDTHVNEDRIVFDDKCYAYTYLDTTVSSLNQGMLLFSKDRGKTWEVYLIPQVELGMMATLEYKSGSNNIVGPPTLLIHRIISSFTLPKFYKMYTTKPILNSNGTLTIPQPSYLISDSLLTAQHSGTGGNIVTYGSKSYIVYPSNNEVYCKDEVGKTPTIIMEYNHVTKTVTSRKFIGCGIGDPSPDPHENPAITVDSHGYLHVILGAHQDQFQYTKTTLPYNINSWTTPTAIGEMKIPYAPGGSYTYISLLSDSSDTLHLVARWAGRLGSYHRLVYMRKRKNMPWDTFENSNPNRMPGGTNKTLLHKELVIPWHEYYAVWRHKLSLDNAGRLFLNYSTLGWQYSDEQAAEYRKKWPEDNLVKDDPTCIPSTERPYCDYSKTAKEHNPVLMVSYTHGDTWQLANTIDLKHFTIVTNPADLEPDGDVDIFDFNSLVSRFGQTGAVGWIRADIIKNGVVDISDFNKLVENFGL